MSLIFVQSLTAFFCTLAAITALAPIARSIGLVDAPSERKAHKTVVPLIGGLAIFFSFVTGAAIWGGSADASVLVKGQDALHVLLGCCAFLVFTGSLDDRFQLGVFVRVVSEILVALVIIEMLDLRLIWLGDLLGTGEIKMPTSISYAFSVVAIFGVMNAFNMLDGMDGLLTLMVASTLISFHIFTGTAFGFASFFVLSSLAAFLVSNLGLTPLVPKSFLGDAGSKLLGFVVVCLLLTSASGQVGGQKLIQPVTALFLIAIPLFDMVFTTLRRITRGASPFAADRSHIHHLLTDLGFSHRRTILIILALNFSATGLGLLLGQMEAPEHFQFSIYIGSFTLYCLLASQAWIVTKGR